MGFVDYVKKGIDIVMLKGPVAASVAKDPKATGMGILIIILAGVAAAIGQLNLLGIILLPIMTIIGSFIGVGILHVVALIFGGKAAYMELYRAVATAYVVNWVAVIPMLGPMILAPLAGLWSLVVSVVVIKNVYKLSTGKAVAVVLIPVVVIAILVMILATFLAATFLGGMMGGMYMG